MRGGLAWIIAATFLAGVAMAQPASQGAKDQMAREWLDVGKTYPEWDAQAKRPATGPQTTGLEHCLAALELATRPQPDKEGALNELISGREKGSTSYLLPPELQDNLWDWLASATTPLPADPENRGQAPHAA